MYDTSVKDVDRWVSHFADIQAGRVRHDHKGRYIVGSGSRTNQEANQPDRYENQLKVNLVTPVAQAINRQIGTEARIKVNGVPPRESGKHEQLRNRIVCVCLRSASQSRMVFRQYRSLRECGKTMDCILFSKGRQASRIF